MKKILVSQRIIENESYPETREGLDLRWGSFFAGAGLIPCPVLSAYPSAELFEQLEPAGVLLSGGNDLSQLSNTRLNVSRDKVDTKLLDQAVARNVPVLGVCRGMQFIAHYFDSTLEPVDKHIACDHNLEVNVDSRHAKLISPIHQVNSFHSVAPVALGQELRVVAHAPDRSIEAIEHTEKAILGIMWHPERRDSFLQAEMDLFQEFFA